MTEPRLQRDAEARRHTMFKFILRRGAALAAAVVGLWVFSDVSVLRAQTTASAPTIELTVEQAIAKALGNNRDIEVARVDLRSAEVAVQAAAGLYDPVISISGFREKRTVPVSSILGGSTTGSLHEGETQLIPAVAALVEPVGGGLTASVFNDRGTSDNLFLPLSPQYSTAMILTYTQPLMRGLRIDATRRALFISRKNVALTDSQFRQRVMDTVNQVVQAYWDLALARENLDVQNGALQDARRLVESNRRLMQEGVLAPIDLVETRTQVAAIETAAFVARDIVNRTQNAFKLLLLPNRMSVEWAAEVIPVSTPLRNVPKVDYASAVKLALEKRPEPEQMRQASDINDINTRYFRDQTRPLLNLIGSYTSNGLAGIVAARPGNPLFGSLDIVPPSELQGGYSKSLANLMEQKFPTVRVGVQLQMPVRNRTAE